MNPEINFGFESCGARSAACGRAGGGRFARVILLIVRDAADCQEAASLVGEIGSSSAGSSSPRLDARSRTESTVRRRTRLPPCPPPAPCAGGTDHHGT